jgi:hypothetical protein
VGAARVLALSIREMAEVVAHEQGSGGHNALLSASPSILRSQSFFV